jgi:hypothetical protein
MVTYLAWMAVRLVSEKQGMLQWFLGEPQWQMIGKQCPESIIALPAVYKPMQDLSVEW